MSKASSSERSEEDDLKSKPFKVFLKEYIFNPSGFLFLSLFSINY